MKKHFTHITEKSGMCRFVNDVLHFLKNFAIYKESPDIISRGFPIKRTHRKLVIVIVIYL